MKLSYLVKRCGLALLFALSLVSVAAPATSANSRRILLVHQHSGHNLSHHGKFSKTFRIAKSKLGHKYAYGASGPRRFDCSGFTKYIYKHGAHINLPRGAEAQYNAFAHSHHARQGELVFFGPSKHSISHVGMCISSTKMIDAQNRGVVIENIHAPWWHRVGYSKPLA